MQSKSDVDSQSGDSKVRQFFEDKTIFLTGATGFLGIALVEKLLRECRVGKIYALMRPKRGKEIESRHEELTKNLVFERLIKEQGKGPLSKIIPIAGDVGEENLGLSEKDRQTLIDNVDIVFHSAATLDFEAGLKPTVTINLLGTRRVVELATEMKKIEVLVHVSSAYVNSNRSKADEVLYEAPGEVDKVIHLATTMSEEDLENVTPWLLGNHPNTYTLTKSFAEHEVAKVNKFPTAIVRPSMIVAAWKEPSPGWTISKNGPQGFIMGAGKGVVRRLPVSKNLIYDYIPVDIVVNELIAAGWKSATSRKNETMVYHCTSSTYRPFTWSLVEDRINAKLRMYPLKSAIWYPTMKLLPSLELFRASAIIFHFIPAFFLDLLLRVTGGRPILMKLHTNVSRSLGRLAPFIFQEWHFDNKNTLNLQKTLCDVDKYKFNLDIKELEWDAFFTELVRGVRRYLHKEEPKTLNAARMKLKVLFIMNILVQALVFTSVWYLYSVARGCSMFSAAWILLIMFLLFRIL